MVQEGPLCDPGSEFFPFFFRTLQLSSLWTSRGHRFLPFFPPVLSYTTGIEGERSARIINGVGKTLKQYENSFQTSYTNK